jgi:signal transduction histidine kinase
MILLVIKITAIFGLGVGIAVLWANPRRLVNQLVAATAIIMAITMWGNHEGFRMGERFLTDGVSSAVPWIRLSSALTGLLPWMLWLLKEAVMGVDRPRLQLFRLSLPWLFLGLALGSLCLTEWYLPSDSTPRRMKWGPAFTIRNVVILSAFVFLIVQTVLQMRRVAGIRRIEAQFFVLNLGIAALLAVALAVANILLRIPLLTVLRFTAVFAGYLSCAWGVTFYRIFDVKQVLLSLGQRVVLLSLLGFGVVFTSRVAEKVFSSTTALILSAVVCGILCWWLERKSRYWLDLGGKRALAEHRRSVIEIALRTRDSGELVAEFEALLRRQWKVSFAALLFDGGHTFHAPALDLRKDQPAYVALSESGWTTPESLDRRQRTAATDDLRRFVAEHALGVVVSSPSGSRTPSLVLALGEKPQSWPFTYPEVQRLQNIAELMENVFSRSRLAIQAALNARVEHLAIMSRGLAHDLKNLITPISSYLIHTENNVAAGTPEAEVHSAAQRSVRVMTDYIREALFFSQRLDPDFSLISFRRIFDDVQMATAKRAADRGVKIVFDLTGTEPLKLKADAVLLQRLLGNLVVNAADASRAGQTVSVSASSGCCGWVRLIVSDKGSGIPPENLPRIFDPYFTTKEFGEDVRGFGLGLTICQKIAHLHGGSISVASQLGLGTTMTVELLANPSEVASAPIGAESV